MKLTYIELAKQGKTVNASLIPDSISGGILEWSVECDTNAYVSYNVMCDIHEQQFQVEVFVWSPEADEWISNEIINGEKAMQMAKSFNLIV